MFLMGVVKESVSRCGLQTIYPLSYCDGFQDSVIQQPMVKSWKVGFWPRYLVWLIGGPLNTPQQNPLSGPTTLNQD